MFLRQTDKIGVAEEMREIEASVQQSSHNTASIFDVFKGSNLKGNNNNNKLKLF